MRRALLFAGLTGLVLSVVLAASCGTAESQIPGADAPKVVSQILGRGDSPDKISGSLEITAGKLTKSVDIENASEVMVVRNTFVPGASTGWHSHTGPAIVVVASGDFVYVRASDCERLEYASGQSFIDPGHGNVHVGFNPSETEKVVLYATYLEVPKGKPQTNPARATDC